ncbi:acetylornithine deacetylase [Lewinella marina]|uniref:Acetylornithine deacetylase n=1 Tax=Neolewinella marina TaxID=438751 RepID=A0A2G0CK28_9BACT|nr:acetylornithine deacetylase [Neolewinella marina]NJB84481.1 acetylornithine deacetylase [Neolewinella marina]PHL00327.1 acetylornithine deacetylase [Neolewinella marina]
MTTTEILSHLVAFPVLGGESNLSIIRWIADYLRDQGVEYTLVPDETGEKACLHCRIGPATDGGIILSGHTDVVPTVGQPWDTDPFELTPRGDKLYARGSCDMKGFLASCLAAVPRLRVAELRRPVYFAFSFDEEVGCRAGDLLAGAIRDHYTERPAGAIIGEPTMMQPMVGQKGIMVYTTVVRGSQGHSSRIRDEVDAVHEAAHLILWLEDKMHRLIEAGRTDDRFSPNHTSIHVGKIAGGSAFNIIANECRFEWDYRNIPLDDAAKIFADFEAFCCQREELRRTVYPEFSITHLPFHPPVPPLDTAEDAPIVDLVKRISGNSRTGTVAYAAEAGQFSNAGFPSVICGPGDIAQAHRANEFVAREQLDRCDAMIAALAEELSATE